MKKGMMKKSFLEIFVYATICFNALFPFSFGLKQTVRISLILSLIFGFLNEIINQLRKLN